MTNLSKKIIIALLALVLFFGFFQLVQAVDKSIGETANIAVTCSDVDGNLLLCNVTSPCAQSCPASGFSGSCSCVFTCVSEGLYDACGRAMDTLSAIDNQCLDTVNCISNFLPYIESGSQVIDYEDYCTVFIDTGYVGFSWKYRDNDLDNQSRFDFRVNDVNDVNDLNPEVDRTFDGLSNPEGSVNNQVVDVVPSPTADKINYNKTYYWWSKVWDSAGTNSGWIQGPSFTTPLHAYPSADFSWSPETPAQEEIVIFTSEATGLFYLWEIVPPGEGAYVDDTGNTDENPHIKFLTLTNRVKLTVTDAEDYSCNSEPIEGTLIEAQLPLPEYKEIPPIIWLKKLLVGISYFFNGFLNFN